VNVIEARRVRSAPGLFRFYPDDLAAAIALTVIRLSAARRHEHNNFVMLLSSFSLVSRWHNHLGLR
jgi:hypothetical protein